MTTPKTATTTAAAAKTSTPERATYLFHFGDADPMFVDLTPDQANLMEFLRNAGLLEKYVEWERLDEVVRQAP